MCHSVKCLRAAHPQVVLRLLKFEVGFNSKRRSNLKVSTPTLPHLLRHLSASLVVSTSSRSAFPFSHYPRQCSTPSILLSFLPPPNSWHHCLTSSRCLCCSLSPSVSVFVFLSHFSCQLSAIGAVAGRSGKDCSVRFIPAFKAYRSVSASLEKGALGSPAWRQVAVLYTNGLAITS